MQEQARYLIIGGGVASVCAAQAIREHDTDGRILIVREEAHVPYDRPPLSKGFLKKNDVNIDDISSKYEVFYTDNHIDRKLGCSVTALDPEKHTATCSDGTVVEFEKVLIATGSRAKVPDVPGVNLPGVFPLRSMDDAESIRQALGTATHVLIVGSGYMAFEIASACLTLGKTVDIVTQDPQPWVSFATSATGQFVADLMQNAGVALHAHSPLHSIEPGLAVKAGEKEFSADLVILATGIVPNVELAYDAGLRVDPAHGIIVNDYLLATTDVYVAGDVAYFEGEPRGRSGEHHLNAKWQGAIAGANMAGQNLTYDRVPYFWTDFLDQHMILRGSPDGAHAAKVLGDREKGEFTELYADAHGNLRMAIAFSHDEPSLDKLSDRLEAHMGQPVDMFVAEA